MVRRRRDADFHMREALAWRPKRSIRSGRLAGSTLRSSAASLDTWRGSASSTSVKTPRFCCCLAVQSCTARFAPVIRRAAFSGRPLRSTVILTTRPPLLVRNVVAPRFASGAAAAASAAPAASSESPRNPTPPRTSLRVRLKRVPEPCQQRSRIVPFASVGMKCPMSSGWAAQASPPFDGWGKQPTPPSRELEPHVRVVPVNAPSRQAGDDALRPAVTRRTTVISS